jgi:hypothetical protein
MLISSSAWLEAVELNALGRLALSGVPPFRAGVNEVAEAWTAVAGWPRAGAFEIAQTPQKRLDFRQRLLNSEPGIKTRRKV